MTNLFVQIINAALYDPIARRYFVKNTFDGILTVIGILAGFWISGVKQPGIIILGCVGAAIAIAVAGLWGAYFTEKAERLKRFHDLEKELKHARVR
ncbi:hypothetical protein COT72_05600 [archaeon CG10_big_fil_rev_8_21_14_0_10_43_11]|nr:MAG: hypothetical protein COT72_05600 [archaeon CG10_big_fil_rev_8_21_14_0_10_43_11]